MGRLKSKETTQHDSYLPHFYSWFIQLRISSMPFIFISQRTLIYSALKLIFFHFCRDPLHKIFHFGVDTKLPRRGATITPAGGTVQVISPARLTHHRPTTIPLTGVNATLVQACADHGVVDFIGICLVTAGTACDWHRNLLKISWRRPPWSKSAPSGDPAFVSVYWRVDIVW